MIYELFLDTNNHVVSYKEADENSVIVHDTSVHGAIYVGESHTYDVVTKTFSPDPNFVEPTPELGENAAPIVYPAISPIEFKLLFTSPERIAIKNSTDPIVLDFFEIVNDPRLTKVNMNLQTTQDALSYLEAVELIAAGRKQEILDASFQFEGA